MSTITVKPDVADMTAEEMQSWFDQYPHLQFYPNNAFCELWDNGIAGGTYDHFTKNQDGSYSYKHTVEVNVFAEPHFTNVSEPDSEVVEEPQEELPPADV